MKVRLLVESQSQAGFMRVECGARDYWLDTRLMGKSLHNGRGKTKRLVSLVHALGCQNAHNIRARNTIKHTDADREKDIPHRLCPHQTYFDIKQFIG